MTVHPFRRPPLVPEDRNSSAVARAEARAIWRMCAAHVLTRIHGGRPQQFAERQWPEDQRTHFLTRAATSPDSTTGSASALSITKVSPLLLIAPGSAVARLLDKGAKFSLDGISQVSVPHVATHPVPLWVQEGSPIPIVQPGLGSSVVGPVRKLSFGVVVSEELENSAENAATLLGKLLGEAAARSLDTYALDNQPASDSRPAGLLYGVTPINSTANFQGTVDDISADIGALAEAFAAANIDSQNMLLIVSTSSYWQLMLTRGFQQTPLPVFPSLAVTPGTVVAAIPESVASGYQGQVEIEVSRQTAVHMEDSLPQQIGTVGSPNVIAAPVRSLMQTASIAIKLRMRCAFAPLAPGCIQQMTGCKW
jgi:hypothetical protein